MLNLSKNTSDCAILLSDHIFFKYHNKQCEMMKYHPGPKLSSKYAGLSHLLNLNYYHGAGLLVDSKLSNSTPD